MILRTCCAGALALTLAGCGTTLFQPSKVEYKTERKLPPLDVPPDLTVPAQDDRYQVPEAASSATTLSAYTAERRAGPPADRKIDVLPAVDKARVERSADQPRWSQLRAVTAISSS